jgi:mannose-6-phosphate isomerase-like protein (cupin superfamily)
MAYIFHEDSLPKLISATPGRERTFFVNQELAKTDDVLAGVMHYDETGHSPYHYHENCEHFYFIMEGNAEVKTAEGVKDVKPGTLVFIPAEARHSLRAVGGPLFYFELQAPNRFKTHMLSGGPEYLVWNHRDGVKWVQT